MSTKIHWESVYRTKRPDEVSWYRAHLDRSLRLIADAARDPAAPIIDVGGGESTLVDDLVEAGYRDVTVLDLSETALEVARKRLGERARGVHWLAGDATTYPFEPDQFDVWHDRAVFHFLTEEKSRARYVAQVQHAVRPGGTVIVATFGPRGPAKCSGLDVVRYDPDSLHDQFGGRFTLLGHETEMHETPMGAVQEFVYCYCRLQKP